MCKKCCLSLLGALFLTLAFSLSAAAPFSPGEKAVFIGDSITAGGDFVRWTQFLYYLRNPAPLYLEGVGISGDQAFLAHRRLSWDVFPRNPQRAFVMLGMNDLGCGLYRKGGKELTGARLRHLENYKKNMIALCDALDKKKIKVVLITPTPYDQYGKGDKATYNEIALTKGARFIKELAGKRGYDLVDFHTPFTEILKKRPKLSPIHKDRIHPNGLGHLLMAYYLWKETKMDGKMGTVTVDYAAGKVESRQLAEVSDIKKTPRSLTFQYTTDRLPFMDDGYCWGKIETLVPSFVKEYNSEILRVKNLPPGRYRLTTGGKTNTYLDAKVLAQGINLTRYGTPAKIQARKAFLIMQNIRNLQNKLRNIATGDRMVSLEKNGDMNDYASSCKAVDNWFKRTFKGKDTRDSRYYVKWIKNYKMHKKDKKKLEAELEKNIKLLRKECKKVSYTVELTKV